MTLSKSLSHMAAYTALALYSFDLLSAPLPALAYTLLLSVETTASLKRYRSRQSKEEKEET